MQTELLTVHFIDLLQKYEPWVHCDFTTSCSIPCKAFWALVPSCSHTFLLSMQVMLIKVRVQCLKLRANTRTWTCSICSLKYEVHQNSCKLLTLTFWWFKVYGYRHRSLNVTEYMARADIFMPECRRCTQVICCSCFLSLSRMNSVEGFQ